MRIFVDFSLRDHLVAPLKATFKGAQQPSFLFNAHIISLDATIHGKHIMSGGGFFFGSSQKVAAPRLSHVVFHVVYQPESHFWPLELTETALFVGLAAVLILFAAWWTHERTA